MDERCQRELHASLAKCQQEEENIATLINQMLLKQKQLLDNINPSKMERKKIIEFTQHNYTLFNKLFSITMDLESICETYQSQTQPYTEIAHNNLKTNATQNSDCLSEITVKSHTLSSMSSVESLHLSAISPPTPVYTLNPLVSNFYPSSEVLTQLQTSVSTKHDNTKLPAAQQCVKCNESQVVQSEAEIQAIEEHKSVEETYKECQQLSETLTNDSDESSTIFLPEKSISPVSTKQKRAISIKHMNSITKKEKPTPKRPEQTKYDAKRRFERKYEPINTEIPDLSFIKEDSFSDYHSVAETFDNSVKSGRNVTTINSYVKIDVKENLIDIPEADHVKVDDICIMLYIKDVSEFYLAHSKTDLLIVMSEQLKEFSKDHGCKFKQKLDAKLAINKYCIAYSEEFKTWNRAEIIQWNMTDAENVDIQYVDFGEYTTVKYTKLIPIPDVLCRTPKQAIRCSLQNVKPTNADGEWSFEAIRAFTALSYNNNTYTSLKIISTELVNNMQHVDFMKLGDEITCRETMIINEHALSAGPSDPQEARDTSANFMVRQVRQAQGLGEICDADDPLDALDKFCDVLPAMHETMADAMVGYNAQDDRRLCRFTEPDGSCFKGARCKLEHRFRRKGGVTTDTEEVLIAPESTFMPSVNDVLTVTLTSFKSPTLMYGQVKHDGNNFGGVLREMFKRMNTPEMVKSYQPFKYQPAIGEFVIAKSVDDRWHRGTVLEMTAGEESKNPYVSIFFVDTGEVVDVLQSDVRKMVKGFVVHPHQAVELRISNVRPRPDYDRAAFECFAANYLYTDLSMIVNYAGNIFIDGVFTDENSSDLSAQLIMHNLAERNEMDYHPLRSSNILVD